MMMYVPAPNPAGRPSVNSVEESGVTLMTGITRPPGPVIVTRAGVKLPACTGPEKSITNAVGATLVSVGDWSMTRTPPGSGGRTVRKLE